MNATKNELQHNTMLHYYIGTTVNGAKGIAHTVKANPLWIVAMLVMAWLAYSVQDMRATESMGSIGHLMTVLQSVEMLAVTAIALVVVSRSHRPLRLRPHRVPAHRGRTGRSRSRGPGAPH